MKRLHVEHEQPAGCWEYMFSSKELVLNKVQLIRQTIVEPKQAVINTIIIKIKFSKN